MRDHKKDNIGKNPATNESSVKPKNAPGGIEGEGSYEATRRYDKGVQETVESGRVPDLAKQARRAIDGPEAAELIEAEEKGKKPVLPS